MTYRIEISRTDAPRLLDWLATRGGVAIWSSLDLSRAGERVFTPADLPRPSWHYPETPTEIVTDRADIGVYDEVLFSAFPVSLRRSNNGLTLKLTDGAKRKVDKAMAACHDKHGNSHYKKGVLEDVPASIGVYYSSEPVPL